MPALSSPRNRAPFALTADGLIPHAYRGKLWLEDGDLIVVAANSPPTAWKVSSGVMKNRSDRLRGIYRDLLRTSMPLVERCPVLVLRGSVAVGDIEKILLLMHDKICMPNFRMADNLAIVEEIVRISAFFQSWYHFFDATRPLAYYYQTRLALFATDWDQTYDLPRPISPVHSLNLCWMARHTFELYGGYEQGVDDEADRLFSLFSAGARLDLSLYLNEADLTNRSKTAQRPLLRDQSEVQLHRELVAEHEHASLAILHDCEMFEDTAPESERQHLHCCGDTVRLMVSRLATLGARTTTPRGVYFLKLVRALRTDSCRILICHDCTDSLDQLIDSCYDQWWTAISPLIRGMEDLNS